MCYRFRPLDLLLFLPATIVQIQRTYNNLMVFLAPSVTEPELVVGQVQMPEFSVAGEPSLRPGRQPVLTQVQHLDNGHLVHTASYCKSERMRSNSICTSAVFKIIWGNPKSSFHYASLYSLRNTKKLFWPDLRCPTLFVRSGSGSVFSTPDPRIRIRIRSATLLLTI